MDYRFPSFPAWAILKKTFKPIILVSLTLLEERHKKEKQDRDSNPLPQLLDGRFVLLEGREADQKLEPQFLGLRIEPRFGSPRQRPHQVFGVRENLEKKSSGLKFEARLGLNR